MEINLHNLSYVVFERLSYLNYQKKFLAHKNEAYSLNNDFFVAELQEQNQFSIFKSLVKWLFNLNKIEVQEMSSSLDHLSYCQIIIDKVKSLGYVENERLDIIQLKQGYGKQCLKVLDFLTELILKGKKLGTKKPEFPQQVQNDENIKLQQTNEELEEEEGLSEAEELDENEYQVSTNKNIAKEQNEQQLEWKQECLRVQRKFQQTNFQQEKEFTKDFLLFNDSIEKLTKIQSLSVPLLENISQEIKVKLQSIIVAQIKINEQTKEHWEKLQTSSQEKRQLELSIKQLLSVQQGFLDNIQYIQQNIQSLEQWLNLHSNQDSLGDEFHKLKKIITELEEEINQLKIRNQIMNDLILNKAIQSKKKPLNLQEIGSEELQDFIAQQEMNLKEIV